MKIMFESAVRVPAGYRQALVVAYAKPISARRLEIVGIESIGGANKGYPSLTGAKRQEFCFKLEESKLIGKVKNLSSVIVLGALK